MIAIALWTPAPPLAVVAVGLMLAALAAPLIVSLLRVETDTRRRIRVLSVAVLVAVVAAVSLYAEDVYAPTCSSKFIDQMCGTGESWCRTFMELQCWLAGLGIY